MSVSLVKSYVPTVPVIVGRMDHPVYTPANRTPRSHVNAEADLKLHNCIETFSYVLRTL